MQGFNIEGIMEMPISQFFFLLDGLSKEYKECEKKNTKRGVRK